MKGPFQWIFDTNGAGNRTLPLMISKLFYACASNIESIRDSNGWSGSNSLQEIAINKTNFNTLYLSHYAGYGNILVICI